MNYSLGIQISIFSAIIISFIFLVLYFNKKPWIKNSIGLPTNEFEYYLIITLFFFFIASVTFCFIYSIYNVILNIDLLKNDFREILTYELKNGVIPMRLTSLSLGFVFINTLRRLLKMTPFPDNKTEKVYNSYDEANILGLGSLSATRNRFEQSFLNLTQCSYYSLILTTLWILYFYKVDSFDSVLLSYFLFMIIDDWMIIYNYSLRLKGLILKWDAIKILGLNILLLVFGILATL